MNRRLLWAIGGSLLVHFFVVIAPLMDFSPPRKDLKLLEVKLVRANPELVPNQQAPEPSPAPKPKENQATNPKPVAKKKLPERIEPLPEVTRVAEPPPPLESPPTPTPTPDEKPAATQETPPESPVVAEATPAGTGHAWPRAGQIVFALFMGEQRFEMGQSIHEWEVTPEGEYTLRAVSEPTGVASIPWFKPDQLIWESRGRITPGGLETTYFSEKKVNRGTGVEIVVDRQAGNIRVGQGVHTLPDKVQDILSFMYQLGYPGAVEPGVLPIITPRKMEAYQFEIIGPEDLALPFGKTWKTIHYRASYGGREMTEVWVAPEQFGLPVQIRNVDRKGVIYYLIAREVLVAKDAVSTKQP